MMQQKIKLHGLGEAIKGKCNMFNVGPPNLDHILCTK